MTVLKVDFTQKRSCRRVPAPEGFIVPMTWYIESVKRDAVCIDCGWRRDQFLPATMLAKAFECPGCLKRGYVIFSD